MKKENDSKTDRKRYAYQDIGEIYQEFGTGKKGLKLQQAEERKESGIWEEKGNLIESRIGKAFVNPFTLLLLIVAVISYFTNYWVKLENEASDYSSVVLLIMMFVSGAIRLRQEIKSGKAEEQIQKLVHVKVKVRRSGMIFEIPAKELVPGDLICLSAGNRIPADIRLTDTKDLFISQAAITGESMIVEKRAETYEGEELESFLQYPNLVFMGTTIISGKGEGIVTAVGKNTAYGNSYIESRKKSDTFEKGANSIAKVMLKYMFILVPIVFLVSGIAKGNWSDAFLFAVSAAVGLTPEMLPIVITACLAKGSMMMSGKKTIIKNMNSMQGFGSMDILCVDKTGTLTNETILLEYYMDILGNESTKVLDYAYVNSVYHSGVRNPIDDAIAKCKSMPGKKQYYENLLLRLKKEDEIPFDYERKCVSVLVSDSEGNQEMILKGDPEAVLRKCRFIEYKEKELPVGQDGRKSMDQIIEEMLEDGMKVIAIARKSIKDKKNINESDEADMVLMGYVAFFDAPKPSAEEAIRKLKNLHVKIKILTGDKWEIAGSVCRRVGLKRAEIMTGDQLEAMSEEKLQAAVEYTDVFAELTPSQKVRILKILKENGHTVGFLGDGINDIPAICEADVGISVDTAVDAAKEVADVVLLEKNLNVLEAGILEGRKTFINMSKYIRITASSNFGNIFSIVCASAFLPFLPMTAVQILLLNLLYDGLCMILPWDRVDEEDCQRPREWSGRTLGRFMRWFGPISSLFDIVTFFFLYFVLCPSVCGGLTFGQISDPETAVRYISVFQTGWFLESMWSQILILQMLRTEKIPFVQSRPAKGVSWMMAAGIFIFSGIMISPVGHVLGLTPLPAVYFLFLTVVVCSYLIMTTFVKYRFVKKYHGLV